MCFLTVRIFGKTWKGFLSYFPGADDVLLFFIRTDIQNNKDSCGGACRRCLPVPFRRVSVLSCGGQIYREHKDADSKIYIKDSTFIFKGGNNNVE